ncbi:MAG TPA: hypothetical protein VGP93_04230, partial [Polyangiaceae bacterium]|nr:hypothetical protein [Polyangiaceae bacterium]
MTTLWSSPARTQSATPSATAFQWTRLAGAEACPGLEEVTRQIEGHLGREALVPPSSATVFVEASIGPVEGGGWNIHILVSNGAKDMPGTRDIFVGSPECSEAADTAALAVALMIDSDAGTPTNPGTPPSTASTSAPAPPPTPEAPRPAASAASSALEPSTVKTNGKAREFVGLRTELGLGLLGSIGQLPGLGWGGLVAVRLSPASH